MKKRENQRVKTRKKRNFFFFFIFTNVVEEFVIFILKAYQIRTSIDILGERDTQKEKQNNSQTKRNRKFLHSKLESKKVFSIFFFFIII